MAIVAKGYRVVPQRLAHGGHGFRHLHLKEHKRVFKATVEGGEQLEFAKGTTLFVGNVDDQGVDLSLRVAATSKCTPAELSCMSGVWRGREQ